MKKDTLAGVSDQLTGGNADAPNGRNLVACLNQLDTILDQMEEWGLSSFTDLPEEKQVEVEELQEDLQYHLARVGNDLADVAGDDGAIEDENGKTIIDLPKAALSPGTSKDLPDTPSN